MDGAVKSSFKAAVLFCETFFGSCCKHVVPALFLTILGLSGSFWISGDYKQHVLAHRMQAQTILKGRYKAVFVGCGKRQQKM